MINILASQVLQHPHALTIFEDFVYWSDRYTNRVIRANKWHGGNQTVMIYNIHQPLGLVAVHPVKQPYGKFSKTTLMITKLCHKIMSCILESVMSTNCLG